MAQIVLADDGIVFDGTTPERSPLGGAESAVVSLAQALARRGHGVDVYTRCAHPVHHAGVSWHPIAAGLPARADLYVANRSHHLIGAVTARRQVFWTHNPCRYMLKTRYLWPLWRVKPVIVFVGRYHASTYPDWAPDGGRQVIPLGVEETFRSAVPALEPPPPRAVFTSNPLRGLDTLLDLWEDRVRPAVPGAELHLFCGHSVYGAAGLRKQEQMNAVLGRARRMAHVGVVLRDPLPKAELTRELIASRVMLYRGTPDETFCLAVAEAQAVGLPAVVTAVGSLPERVRDGETGFVAPDDEAFAVRAAEVLGDDALWRRLHEKALETQRLWGWDEAAAAFERLLPEV